MKSGLRVKTLVSAMSLVSGSVGVQAASNLPVTSCLDDGSAGTLRSVVASAFAGDTVDLSHLTCSNSTITLATGSVDILDGDLTIAGAGAQALTIDGADHDRVFKHTGNGALTISKLTVAHGHVHHSGQDTYGGCIYSSGGVVLDHAIVDSCTIDGSADASVAAGGGVASRGDDLVLTASTISHTSVANALVVRGAAAFAEHASLTGSTISYATATATEYGFGGCLYAFGTAQSTIAGSTLTRCALTVSPGGASSRRYAQGGGAWALFDLKLTSSIVSNNALSSDNAYGGGVFTRLDAVIEGSTIRDNKLTVSAGGFADGGGVGIRGTGTITASTIYHNQAHRGGGVSQEGTGTLVVADSTISSNIGTASCGGIYINVPLSLRNSTVAFNNGGQFGGICPNGGSMSSQSSIVAKNTASGGVASDISDEPSMLTIGGSNNLIGVAGTDVILPGDTLHGDPLLLALANNGGPTMTHALGATSPALNHGNDIAGLNFDQRGVGFPRVAGAAVDIGAFELQPADRLFVSGFEAAP